MRVVFVFCTLLALNVVAQLAIAESGFRYRAFNGVNLDGWQVTGCAAGVEDGALVIQSGDGLVRSDFEYGDFVLELEWRPRKASGWDSGIFFRAPLPDEGQPFPKRYQANLKQGSEGNVAALAGAHSSGLAREGWNEMKLTVVGSRATMEINGHPAWQAEGVEPARGYIAIQVEVPLGGQFEFRDIYITELGHRSLFGGHDLDGWQGVTSDATRSWKVEDGMLICTGQKGTWLRSKQQVADFDLRLEYKLLAGGNSGVYVRVPQDGAHREGGGTEVQILDDADPRYKDIEPGQFCGSVYKVAPATQHVSRPAGQWNTLEITCQGASYRVAHNGVVIVDATGEQFPELKNRFLKGFLGLQNHSEEVWFKNIRILDIRN